MKSSVLAVLTTLVLSVAAQSAAAADLQTCRAGGARSDAPRYRHVAKAVRAKMAPEVRTYLGRQFVHQWMQPADAGWYVGVAPGRRSLAQVRTWLARRVGAHFSGSEAALVRSRMHVIGQPYSHARLFDAGERIFETLSRQFRPGWSEGDGCSFSGAWRAEVTLYRESSQADVREARRLLKGLGDVVRVRRINIPQDDSVD
jgi:hypothetical protein